MTFRNTIARRALENVQAFMNRFDVDEVEAYVASAFNYHGEIPFLYSTFKPTDKVEPDRKKEPGGFKVVRCCILGLLSLTEPIVSRFVKDSSAMKSSSRQW
jgi:hypothetical protein